MPRKKKTEDEEVNIEVTSADVAVECDVADAYKGYSSFVVGGTLVTVTNDKVVVFPEIQALLVEGGFIK